MSTEIDSRESREVGNSKSSDGLESDHDMYWYQQLPRAWSSGEAQLPLGDLKVENADFRVFESMSVDFSGEGEHLWLLIERSGFNTDSVSQILRRLASVRDVDIGLSGMKDRHAVTTQWFSLALKLAAGQEDATLVNAINNNSGTAGRLRVLEAVRHGRKLKRGTHEGNRFEVILRNVISGPAEKALLQERLDQLSLHGFPNYFGPQRFGRDGQNLRKALELFSGSDAGESAEETSREKAFGEQPPARKKTGFKAQRLKRGFYLSAARSRLFNELCGHRVGANSWLEAQPGEPMVLGRSRSFFIAEDSDPDICERLAKQEIHTSGALWGRESVAQAKSAAMSFHSREREVLEEFDLLRIGLERAGMKLERRALRASVHELETTWLDDQTLRLKFSLDKGVFATAMLRELVNFCDRS